MTLRRYAHGRLLILACHKTHNQTEDSQTTAPAHSVAFEDGLNSELILFCVGGIEQGIL